VMSTQIHNQRSGPAVDSLQPVAITRTPVGWFSLQLRGILRPVVGRRLSRRALGVLVVLGILALIDPAGLRTQQRLLLSPGVYSKDIVQDWLMARAVLDGQNPYLPENELATRYLPGMVPHAIAHASPHPPIVALLIAPLGVLSYEAMAEVWLGIEVALLVLSVALLCAAATPTARKRIWLLPGIVGVLAWCPATQELAWGQFGSLMLVLVIAAWLALQRQRLRLAGVFLGLAISVKLLPLLLLVYFVAIGTWRVIRWVAATVLMTSLITWLVLGTEAWRSFVIDGLLGEAGFWHATEGNYSVMGAVAHIVEGRPYLPPLVSAPYLLLPLTSIVLIVLLALAWRAWRTTTPELGFAIACTFMLLASPVTWQHYLLLLLGPLLVTVQRLRDLGWPSMPRKLALIAFICMSVSVSLNPPILLKFFGDGVRGSDGLLHLSPMGNLPLFIFVAGPLLLFFVLLRLASAPATKLHTRVPASAPPSPVEARQELPTLTHA
jgi:uncharacterized membrane protein YhaH (DUF805 family)